MKRHLGQSNNLFWVAILLLGLACGLVWVVESPKSALAAQAKTAQAKNMFVGLTKVEASKLYQLIPDIKGKPTLIEFHSKLCLDCKKLSKILPDLIARYPNLVFKKYDVLDDVKTQGKVIKAFKPVSVPVLIYIAPSGKIQTVQYNETHTDKIETAIQTVLDSK